MTTIADRTVLFADLRGSTGIFESLGNSAATHLVTVGIDSLCAVVRAAGGTVVKTLGDGLMASFEDPAAAVRAAIQMYDALAQALAGTAQTARSRPPPPKLQIALARGEVIETGGDCFGDAVNVAARLLDHAGDNEILATAEVTGALAEISRQRFRSLGQLRLRGRIEPVGVSLMACHATRTSPRPRSNRCRAIPIRKASGSPGSTSAASRAGSLPLLFGRGAQASHCIDDSRVSRLHARIDWQGGTFQLTDLSYNGSFVRFDRDPEIVALRRGRCTLHGSGSIGLGASPSDPLAPCVRFEIVHFAETQPQSAFDLDRR